MPCFRAGTHLLQHSCVCQLPAVFVVFSKMSHDFCGYDYMDHFGFSSLDPAATELHLYLKLVLVNNLGLEIKKYSVMYCWNRMV